MPSPSESVSTFLDLARSRRVIQPDFVDDLSRRPDLPQENVAAVCDYLESRGVLTNYQADLVRAGRADELTFAGYPVVGELGACPGGTAYRALHPSLRTPIVLRRLRPDWFAPADNAAAAVQRAHDACPVVHPHLAHLLDAGVFRDEPFVTLDPFDGADLFTLVKDIGPMPASLAAAYGRQLALALAAAHARGLTHGDVRPGTVLVGPLVPMSRPRDDGSTRYRPAPTAAVKLFELGLVPIRPALDPWAVEAGLPAEELAFHPPERRASGEPTPAGDSYSLGATLYFLLTGLLPHQAPTTAELLTAIREGEPTPLAELRPDAPAAVVELVRALMAKDPTARPPAADAAARLVTGATPPQISLAAPPSSGSMVTGLAGTAPPGAAPGAAEEPPVGEPVSDLPLGPPAAGGAGRPSGGWVAVPYVGEHDAPTYTPAGIEAWAGPGDAAGFAHVADAPAVPRTTGPRDRGRLWWWIAAGAGLQLLALLGWAVLVFQPGCPGPENTSRPPPRKALP